MADIGAYKGYDFRRTRIKYVMPSYEGRSNPLLYFAFERAGQGKIAGDCVVAGVKTVRELRQAIDELIEEPKD